MQPSVSAASWPAFPAESWTATRLALHKWTQLVGKTRLALSPMLNHWWHVPLYVTARGLSTASMPYAGGLCELVFDFVTHHLRLHTSNGRSYELTLQAESVAEFYGRYQALLREAGLAARIWPVPVEMADATPFPDDHAPRPYDRVAVERFWQILVQADTVLQEFRSRFVGKCSPVHFFWGSFDLAVTRFSGQPAPPHPGGVPNLADWVTRESYSAEQSAAGWWPGDESREAAFYSYGYPSLPNLVRAPVRPAAAYFDEQLGEFILPYEAARTDPDPRQAALAFFQSAYESVADMGYWNRPALERPTA